ncbi:hypothetical protein EWM64_g1808 [Hericium alpestre]|uniref:Uncharacterized protein n=1 Tax=Hericium alpestre TaxID=135208 RepID=A0A4Z0A775_9AGAM|nr:hypothetical protein EWM64_g1808 [Hericium alpestre]
MSRAQSPIARLAALAMSFAWGVIGGSVGLNGLIKGNQAKSHLRHALPPTVSVDINTNGTFPSPSSPPLPMHRTHLFISIRMMSMALTLEPQVLYICLTQLLVPGFHWGLYFTDERRVATRHEWAEVKGARDRTSPVEAYGVTIIDPVTESDQENRFNLAFIKVRGYTQNALDVRAMFAGLEASGGSNSWRENRKNGLSCRTWLMRALALLQREGAIVREKSVEEIEKMIKKIGTEVERRLGEGEYVGTLITEV